MGNVVAIDAGTTGVRALVVDEQARVVDVAYREITQYFPRPGWVEHDPAEIWDAVRATLAEVGGRLAEAGDTVAAIGITNQRETLVAFDRHGRPLHRAIVWQDRRTADICAALERDGHLPMVRETTGLMLDPYFTATKITWLLRQGDLALPRLPRPRLRHRRQLAAVEPDRGTDGGQFATDPSNASRTMLLDTATLAWSADLCALFGVPPHTLPEVRPSAGRFGRAHLPDLGPAAPSCTGSRSPGVLGDQQAALFGQACFEPGMVKVTYGTGSFVLANAGPDRPAAPDGLTVSVAWDLGTHATGRDPGTGRADRRPGRLRARGVDLRLRRRHPVAARRARHHRRGGRDRPAGRVGGRQRRRHLRARPHRAGQPLVGPGRPRDDHRHHPGHRAGPRSPGPAWRPWPSRCAT
jgi:glycerol kinase